MHIAYTSNPLPLMLLFDYSRALPMIWDNGDLFLWESRSIALLHMAVYSACEVPLDAPQNEI